MTSVVDAVPTTFVFVDTLNLFVIVPQFSETSFPGVYSFNYGNVFTENNQSLPSNKHLFSIIDPLVKFSLEKFK